MLMVPSHSLIGSISSTQATPRLLPRCMVFQHCGDVDAIAPDADDSRTRDVAHGQSSVHERERGGQARGLWQLTSEHGDGANRLRRRRVRLPNRPIVVLAQLSSTSSLSMPPTGTRTSMADTPCGVPVSILKMVR